MMTKARRNSLIGIIADKIKPRTLWTTHVCNQVTVNNGVTEPGMCSKFARVCSLTFHGNKYQHLFGENAIETGERMKASPYNVPLEHGSVPGDILVWTTGHGKDGHTGIRVEGNLFANNTVLNSVYDDGRGFRRLADIDAPDVICRLP